MEMSENSCYEIRKTILKLNSVAESIDTNIEKLQKSSAQFLRNILFRKHLLLQRLFYTEIYLLGQIPSPIDLAAFTSNGDEVYNNFASVVLPDDFSKGPMKAFLNTLLDSLESFLPAFYKLNPSKLPRGSLGVDSSKLLLRCIIPSLFSYGWAEEPAMSYAKNLATWFAEIYRETPSFINTFCSSVYSDKNAIDRRNQEKHWMSQAIRGFFTSIDVSLFVNKAIRPCFFKFVQLETRKIQSDPAVLLQFAINIVQSIHENFAWLPSVFNDFFEEILSQVQENERRNVFQHIFYDLFLKPFFDDPLLYNVSDVQLPIDDFDLFYLIYVVFEIKFGKYSILIQENDSSNGNININNVNVNDINIEIEIGRNIQKIPEFDSFDPFIILDDVNNKKAGIKLPQLYEFCNNMQCAYQPLLMTTHSLSILFRFVASLQHTALLPKSIDRSISKVFQEALADKLEVLPDYYFWFPCYSLKYLNIPKIKLKSTMKLSSLYRLLSNEDLRISPLYHDFVKALQNAVNTTNITTHPDIRTEIQWLLRTYHDSSEFLENITEEIKKKEEDNKQKQLDFLELVKFSKLLEIQYSLLMDTKVAGPMRSISYKIYQDFKKKYSGISIRSNAFLKQAQQRIEEFCNKSYKIIGPWLAALLIIDVTPCIKYIRYPTQTESTEEQSILRSYVSPVTLVSSLYSISAKLIPDLSILDELEKIDDSVTDAFDKVYCEPFIVDSETLSINIESLLLTLPEKLLELVFTPNDIELLKKFVNSCKSRIPDNI